MPSGAPGESREVTLKRAIKTAGLPSRDRNLFRDLLETADWKTAVLPDRFQPRNMDAVARIAGVSPRTAQRSIEHLEKHGWITRTPNRKPGRQGRAISYGFEVGEPCRCKPDRPAPVSGVERTRQWRERKIRRQIGVTPGEIQRQSVVTFDATQRHKPQVDAGIALKRARDEGSSGGGDYLGGPVPWEPEDIEDWMAQT